jgi:protein-tyrosine phosphatase
MIDLHTHLLPGIDDGPDTIEESLELAAAMAAESVTIAACTPHVRDDYGTTAETMETALALLQQEMQAAGIPLEVRGGGEIALERLPGFGADELARFGLGGNPHLLLLEFPYFGWPLALPTLVAELRTNGIKAVIAHPERSEEVQEQPELLRPLVEDGACIQLTAGSFDGSAGPGAANCARSLLDHGLAHLVASDSHGRGIRRAGLGTVADMLRDEALATWLTTTVPSALIAGSPLPPRPGRSYPRRRRTWPFR